MLLLALAAAGCGGGGGSTKVPGDAVAIVNGDSVSKASYDAQIARTKRGYKQQHRAFPKAGTPQFQQIQQSAITFLVQSRELEQKAKELGVKLSDEDISKRFAQIRRQLGGQKNLESQAKANGLTLQDVRDIVIRPQLLSEGIYKKVTGDVKASDSDVSKYYASHLKLYQQPESRDVLNILVTSRPLANKLYDKIKAGADFGKLAQKYSKEPTSAKQGGKLTIVKGQMVGPVDQTVFLLNQGQVSRPVKSQYGWHIIKAVGPVKPASTTPLNSVKAAIKQQLVQQRKRDKWSKWISDTKKEYAKKVDYQVGYAPPSTSTSGK
jgi:foldase protein PrsA